MEVLKTTGTFPGIVPEKWRIPMSTPQIHYVIWKPVTEPIGVCQLLHGTTEHLEMEQYNKMAKQLVEKRWLVFGAEHRGHGDSTNGYDVPIYLGDHGAWESVLADHRKLYEMVTKEYPSLPKRCFGLSFGAIMAQCMAIKYPGMFDTMVLMGASYQSSAELKVAEFLARIAEKQAGYAGNSKLIDALTDYGPKVAKRVESREKKKIVPDTPAFWLTSNSEAASNYLQDPKVAGGRMTVGMFAELLDAMSFANDVNNIKQMAKDTRVVFISGKDDAAGNFTKGIEANVQAYKKAGLSNVESVFFDGRHELLLDNGADEVTDYVCAQIAA